MPEIPDLEQIRDVLMEHLRGVLIVVVETPNPIVLRRSSRGD